MIVHSILTLEKAAMTDSQSIESEFEEVYHKILDTATHPTVYIGEVCSKNLKDPNNTQVSESVRHLRYS